MEEKSPDQLLIDMAEAINVATDDLPESIDSYTAATVILLIAAARVVRGMSGICRRSIAHSDAHSRALLRGAVDADKAASHIGGLAQGGVNWLKAIDNDMAKDAAAVAQGVVDFSGWNNRVVSASESN